MKVDITYAALERITYTLSEYEAKQALIECVKRIRQDAVPPGGSWTVEWWDDDDGKTIFEVVQLMKRATPEPDDKH